MLYDLNIAWSPATGAGELNRALRFSAQLGYHVVALNHILDGPIPPQVTNPMPKFASEPSQPASAGPPLPQVLHRATVVLSDPSTNHRLPHVAQAYDVVAVRPQNEKAFQAACLSVMEASLISLDLSQRLPFHFRPKPCMAAINRGMRFEVCYAQMLGADARGRAAFIGNVMSLVRATRGRGIVVSSEARSALGLRGPADVVNLLAVWGLGTERGTEGLGSLPRGVVVNEGIKRRGFRGVIDVVAVAEKADDRMEDVQAAGGGGGSGGTDPEGSGQAKANANGKKRKDGDDAQGEAPVSKRQAKKLRKLAMIESKKDPKS